MKILLFFAFFFTSTVIQAQTYYAKIEPLELVAVASRVQGEVLVAKEDMLGKRLGAQPYIVIDDEVERAQLKAVEEKIDATESMIEATRGIVENLHQSLRRKVENYRKIKNLSSKSKTQKDTVFFDMIATKIQLLNSQKELQNYQAQLADLRSRRISLKKTIRDKHIVHEGMVLYELDVRQFQNVTLGTPLAKVADTSRGLLTIFVPYEELEGIEKKRVFIDDEATSYRVSRVQKIADGVNISKYKVQIIVDAPKIFSKLVKVELR